MLNHRALRTSAIGILLAAFGVGSCATQRAATSPPGTYSWFPFEWYTARIKGKQYQAAMLLPVKVGDIKANFITQFDLGSDASLLYENALKGYFPTRRQLYAHVDTTRRGRSDAGITNYGTRGLPISFGSTRIERPLFNADYGDPIPADSLYSRSTKLVGTVGGDFLAGKALVIDYPGRRMCVLDSVDAYWRARTTFVASRVANNRMHVPLTVGGRSYQVLFDTGSSLFALTTDEQTWRQLVGSGQTPTDTLVVGSWGKPTAFYAAPVQAPIYLGSYRLPAAQAWFTRDPRQLAFMRDVRIDALTGNALFNQSVVVLDFRRQRFGVVRP